MKKICSLILLGLFSAHIPASDQMPLAVEQIRKQLATQEFSLKQNSTLPKGYLSGYHLSNVDGGYVLRIRPGEAKDLTNFYDIRLLVDFSKNIQCTTWVEGNGACGLAPTLTLKPNQTYHVFAMMNEVGNVDIGFDETVDGVFLQFYTNYKFVRRIGSIYTIADPANTTIVEFKQDGDTFYLKTPVSVYDSPAGLVNLSVPKGIEVTALLNLYLYSAAPDNNLTFAHFYSPGTNGAWDFVTNHVSPISSTYKQILTNINGQIQVNYTGYTNIYRNVTITTQGWIDQRNRL